MYTYFGTLMHAKQTKLDATLKEQGSGKLIGGVGETAEIDSRNTGVQALQPIGLAVIPLAQQPPVQHEIKVADASRGTKKTKGANGIGTSRSTTTDEAVGDDCAAGMESVTHAPVASDSHSEVQQQQLVSGKSKRVGGKRALVSSSETCTVSGDAQIPSVGVATAMQEAPVVVRGEDNSFLAEVEEEVASGVVRAIEKSGKLGEVLKACSEGIEKCTEGPPAFLAILRKNSPRLLHCSLQKFSQECISLFLVLGLQPSRTPVPFTGVSGDGLSGRGKGKSAALETYTTHALYTSLLEANGAEARKLKALINIGHMLGYASGGGGGGGDTVPDQEAANAYIRFAVEEYVGGGGKKGGASKKAQFPLATLTTILPEFSLVQPVGPQQSSLAMNETATALSVCGGGDGGVAITCSPSGFQASSAMALPPRGKTPGIVKTVRKVAPPTSSKDPSSLATVLPGGDAGAAALSNFNSRMLLEISEGVETILQGAPGVEKTGEVEAEEEDDEELPDIDFVEYPAGSNVAMDTAVEPEAVPGVASQTGATVTVTTPFVENKTTSELLEQASVSSSDLAMVEGPQQQQEEKVSESSVSCSRIIESSGAQLFPSESHSSLPLHDLHASNTMAAAEESMKIECGQGVVATEPSEVLGEQQMQQEFDTAPMLEGEAPQTSAPLPPPSKLIVTQDSDSSMQMDVVVGSLEEEEGAGGHSGDVTLPQSETVEPLPTTSTESISLPAETTTSRTVSLDSLVALPMASMTPLVAVATTPSQAPSLSIPLAAPPQRPLASSMLSIQPPAPVSAPIAALSAAASLKAQHEAEERERELKRQKVKNDILQRKAAAAGLAGISQQPPPLSSLSSASSGATHAFKQPPTAAAVAAVPTPKPNSISLGMHLDATPQPPLPPLVNSSTTHTGVPTSSNKNLAVLAPGNEKNTSLGTSSAPPHNSSISTTTTTMAAPSLQNNSNLPIKQNPPPPSSFAASSTRPMSTLATQQFSAASLAPTFTNTAAATATATALALPPATLPSAPPRNIVEEVHARMREAEDTRRAAVAAAAVEKARAVAAEVAGVRARATEAVLPSILGGLSSKSSIVSNAGPLRGAHPQIPASVITAPASFAAPKVPSSAAAAAALPSASITAAPMTTPGGLSSSSSKPQPITTMSSGSKPLHDTSTLPIPITALPPQPTTVSNYLSSNSSNPPPSSFQSPPHTLLSTSAVFSTTTQTAPAAAQKHLPAPAENAAPVHPSSHQKISIAPPDILPTSRETAPAIPHPQSAPANLAVHSASKPPQSPASSKSNVRSALSPSLKANTNLSSVLSQPVLAATATASSAQKQLQASSKVAPQSHYPPSAPNPVAPSGVLSSYDISDHEGDSEEEEEEEEEGGGSGSGKTEKPKKPFPEWARGPALEAAIHNQYSDSTYADPEVIFGSVAHCELEDIFKAKKKRYGKRTSSGVWMGDALTATELNKYRSDMGYIPSSSQNTQGQSSSSSGGGRGL